MRKDSISKNQTIVHIFELFSGFFRGLAFPSMEI